MTKVPAREGRERRERREGREGRGDFNYNKQTPYKELGSLGYGILSYFSPSTKLSLNQRKRENSSLPR